MIPIVAHPKSVEQFSLAFKSMFSKPQFENFKRYLSGLIISDNKTLTAISSKFLEGVDQSNLNRFLTQSDWSPQELNELRLKLLEKNTRLGSKKKGIIIIDDSLIDKTGKKIEGVLKILRPHQQLLPPGPKHRHLPPAPTAKPPGP